MGTPPVSRDFEALLAEAVEAHFVHEAAQKAEKLARSDAYRAEHDAWAACVCLPPKAVFYGYTYEQFRSLFWIRVDQARAKREQDR